VAEFSFDAPVKTGRDREAQYAFVLIQRGADPIVDPDNRPLGLNTNLKWGNTVDGTILRAVMKDPNLSLQARQPDEERYWAATHRAYTKFSVRRDTETPRLLSVLARRDYLEDDGAVRDRIELNFSEPMVVYPRIAAPGTLRIDQWAFAVGVNEAALETVLPVDGSVSRTLSPSAGGADVRTALLEGSVRLNMPSSVNNDFRLGFGVRDARTLLLDLPAGSLPLNRDVIKVRVGVAAGSAGSLGFADPAGNLIRPEDAVQTGSVL
jgi:hypothetical protein